MSVFVTVSDFHFLGQIHQLTQIPNYIHYESIMFYGTVPQSVLLVSVTFTVLDKNASLP
jgi:hypothetical protein